MSATQADPFPRFTDGTAVPPDAQILELWDRHAMPEHIRIHSQIVCAVALRLADWLAAAGIPLVERVVRAGALLHDVAKTPCLNSKRFHDAEGAGLLTESGYPELGRLVGAHVNLPPDHPIDEAMVVYYADKRVKHDRIVDLDERFAYIAEHYARGQSALAARIERSHQRARAVERSLFERLEPTHRPEDIGRDLPSVRLTDRGR